MDYMNHYSALFLCGLIFLGQRCLANKELPANSVIARSMLKEGTFDSLEWLKIEPYYALPLCVPAGELGVLQNLYPQLLSKIPVSNGALRKYGSWSDYDIIHFFHDYPELLDFQPILDFSYSPATFKGRCIFTSNKSEENPLADNKMQFSLEPVKFTKFSGRITFSDKYTRWDNRLLRILLPANILLQIGNVDGIPDKGLFFGCFQKKAQLKDSSIISNWLYGNRQLWNGIHLVFTASSPRDHRSKKVIAIAHKQPNEQIAGLVTEIEIVRNLTFVLGMAGIESAIPDIRTAYVFTGLKISSKSFKTEILTGADIFQPTLFPMLLVTEYLHENGNLLGRVSTFPKSGSYPFSKLRRTMCYTMNTDTINENLTTVALESNFCYVNETRISNSIELDYSDISLINLRVFVNVTGLINRLFWNIGMSGYPLHVRELSNYCNLGTSYSLNRNFQLDFSQKIGFKNDLITFVNFKADVSMSFLTRYTCKPFVEFSSNFSPKHCLTRCGILTVIRLLHDAETRVIFDCPVIKSDFWKGCHLECKAIFVF